jgi:predicted acylesterase/phospholipase RssA
VDAVRYDLLIRRRVRADALIRFRHRPELVAAAIEFALDAYRAGATHLRAIREGRDAVDALYRWHRDHDHGQPAA